MIAPGRLALLAAPPKMVAWNGTEWVGFEITIWDGTTWVIPADMQRWDGTAWVSLYA